MASSLWQTEKEAEEPYEISPGVPSHHTTCYSCLRHHHLLGKTGAWLPSTTASPSPRSSPTSYYTAICPQRQSDS